MTLSLSTLPREILYGIIKQVDRPGKLALGLTGPYFLTILADYYDLDRYRSQPEKWSKLGLPSSVTSWHDPAAYATIIRYLIAGGDGDIDAAPFLDEDGELEEAEHDAQGDTEMFDNPDFTGYEGYGDVVDVDLPPAYEDTDEAVDDELVELLISEWLDVKFDYLDGCVICADCSRFMLCCRPDGSPNPAAESMLHRPRWFRHCGSCEKGYH
ncbi:hypothetical protein BJX99DRAFT_227156 [Aspergillus californicus]